MVAVQFIARHNTTIIMQTELRNRQPVTRFVWQWWVSECRFPKCISYRDTAGDKIYELCKLHKNAICERALWTFFRCWINLLDDLHVNCALAKSGQNRMKHRHRMWKCIECVCVCAHLTIEILIHFVVLFSICVNCTKWDETTWHVFWCEIFPQLLKSSEFASCMGSIRFIFFATLGF